jgi:NTE family protein
MKVEDQQMDKLVNHRFKELSLQEVREQGAKFLVGGGIDVTPLKQLLEDIVDERRIKESDIEFLLGTFNLNDRKEVEISAREVEEGCLKDYLLASSSFPVFKNEKLFGKTFLDGGLVNNVPIDMLVNRGYKNIIVVRIFGPGMEKKIKIPEDVNITYIAPKTHLCSVLEFDKKKAVRNINLGYYDTLRLLRPLDGIDYYFAVNLTERECLQALLNIREEQINELLLVNRMEAVSNDSIHRKYIESILPRLAQIFKLDKSWSYKNLYYTLLEYVMKQLRMKKYKTYTIQEAAEEIRSRYKEREQVEGSRDIIIEVMLSALEGKKEME